MKTIFFLLSILFILLLNIDVKAQCANESNIFSFTYNGNDYEIIKENKTWANAAACAVERGGFLARIDNQEEQNAIYSNVSNNAGIDISNTVAPDGGNASYVWIGGNDMASEGVWIWDGDDDGSGDQFWQGSHLGGPVGGLYSNWGQEPDNFNNQDALGLALTQWPVGNGSLGSASQWNDVDHDNTLYYVVEYVGSVGINDENFNNSIIVFPNPVDNLVFITNKTSHAIIKVSFYNRVGQLVKSEQKINSIKSVDVSTVKPGVYLMVLENEQGNLSRKIIVIE